MPYEISLSTSLSSPTLTILTVADGAVDGTTAVELSGRGNPDYIQVVQEGILHLTENFSKATQPSNVVEGMTWFDKSTQLLNVAGSDLNFSEVGLIRVGATQPPVPGGFWYDTTNTILKCYTGSVYENVMINYLPLTGGTINGPLIVSNDETLGANQPVANINGYVTSTTAMSTYVYTSNISANSYQGATHTASTLDIVTATLQHKNNIVIDAAGSVNVYNFNTSNLIVSFNGVTNVITSNVTIDVNNKLTLNVANASSSTQLINYTQLNGVRPAANTLLLKSGASVMRGGLTVYNLYIQNYFTIESKQKNGNINYPSWFISSGETNTPGRLDLSIIQSNASSSSNVIDIEEFAATPRVLVPSQVKNLTNPVNDTDGATVSYANAAATSFNTAVDYSRIAKAWAVVQFSTTGVLTRRGNLNVTAVSYHPGTPDTLNPGLWLIEPHLKLDIAGLTPSDVVVVSPIYDSRDNLLTTTSVTSLNLWEVQGSIQTTQTNQPASAPVTPYVRVDVKNTDSKEASRKTGYWDFDDTHVTIVDYNAIIQSTFTKPQSTYLYVAVYRS